MFQLAQDLCKDVREVQGWPLVLIAEWQAFYAYKNWLASQQKK